MNKIHTISKRLMQFAAMLICLQLIFASCEKDDEVGIPSIKYVRLTTSPTPITYANLGQTVAIIGQNLQTVKEVTFNGYPGSFKTTMVSDTSIVVKVSTDTPFIGVEANNEVALMTDGGTAAGTLEIAPPAPEIEALSPEYAGTGAEVVITGNYFYDIESVMIGGASAQIMSVDPYFITVKVPEGYSKGKVEVTSSKSGTGTSSFDFGLNTGDIVLDWGSIWPNQGAWWNSSMDGPSTLFKSIGTSYKYIDAVYGNTWWTHDGGIQFDATANRTGTPAVKALKFEYALIGDATWMQILWKSSLGEYKYIINGFTPTNGKWATYTIPMTSFTLGDGGQQMPQSVFEADNPVLVQFALVNSGNTDMTVKLALTNIRIVDK
ncbi:glycan-binding surface protein [Mangrovibacterium sp.]|uniref:glycan-binding surface protein n=1 Tax=Mangrovibacterium sp. TaxID=1961364 RepID=UPI0035628A05